MNQISPLQKARAAYAPKLPPALAHGAMVRVIEGAPTTAVADVEKWVGTWIQPNLYQIISGKHYVAQTHVSIDFDIIKVRFTKGQVNTEIPVVMSPIDFFPDLEPPVTDNFDWLTIAILLALSIGGIIVTRIIKNEIRKSGGKV